MAYKATKTQKEKVSRISVQSTMRKSNEMGRKIKVGRRYTFQP
jgi:hypothetical protein